MPVYKLDKLMEETRRLAAEYRASTGSTLPVSTEIAKYDAMRLLDLKSPANVERAVDAVRECGADSQKIQIKARVLFNPEKSSYRVGQLNLDAHWDVTLLVILNDQYVTEAIFELTRAQLDAEFAEADVMKKSARGAMSVNKFKAMASLVWHADSAEADGG